MIINKKVFPSYIQKANFIQKTIEELGVFFEYKDYSRNKNIIHFLEKIRINIIFDKFS